MDEGMKDLRNLTVLDPANGAEPTEMQWARSRAHVERVIAGEAVARSPRIAPRRLFATGAAALAVGAVAAVAIPALAPGAADQAIAGWTAAPTARTGDQVLPQAEKCAANGTGGESTATRPDNVLLAEQRGEATLLILRKDNGTTVECLMVGEDGLASMTLASPEAVPPPAPAGSVSLETMSSYGDGGDAWSNIVGLADPAVTAVEVRLDNGRTIEASVRGGWWGAWWPGLEGGEVDSFSVVVHAGDRTTSHRPSDLP